MDGRCSICITRLHFISANIPSFAKNTHLTYISVTGNHMKSDTRVSDFMRLYDFNLLDQLIYASHLE